METVALVLAPRGTPALRPACVCPACHGHQGAAATQRLLRPTTLPALCCVCRAHETYTSLLHFILSQSAAAAQVGVTQHGVLACRLLVSVT